MKEKGGSEIDGGEVDGGRREEERKKGRKKKHIPTEVNRNKQINPHKKTDNTK